MRMRHAWLVSYAFLYTTDTSCTVNLPPLPNMKKCQQNPYIFLKQIEIFYVLEKSNYFSAIYSKFAKISNSGHSDDFKWQVNVKVNSRVQ